MRRSNNILFIGVAVFAVGALLAFFGLKSANKPVAKPQSAPITATSPGAGGTATYLLALDTNQAEQVIFYAKYEAMWISLTTPDQKPATSAGRSYQNIL